MHKNMLNTIIFTVLKLNIFAITDRDALILPAKFLE